MLHHTRVDRTARRTITRPHKALVATLAALLTVVVVALTGAPANALASPQTTSQGTVGYLRGDINSFWATNFHNWGWSSYYVEPTPYLYNSTITACGHSLSPNNSWACGRPYLGQIYIGTGWTQGLLDNHGDYAPGVLLAHEWGHEIMYMLGWTSASGTIGQELFADCLAGMYTRYGLTVSHRLDNSDYGEGYNTLAAIAGGDHGTPKQRTDWYAYGYSSYNINSCRRALP
jgi:uncharacterized protein